MGVEDPQFSDIGQITAVFDQRVDTTNVALFGELEYQFARYWRFIMGALMTLKNQILTQSTNTRSISLACRIYCPNLLESKFPAA
ncbi:MAG: hypothetical protein SVC26_09345 [Pseudomonadota bacterium]|nr:hypothetical protein [Pseudomonadota bacterium]